MPRVSSIFGSASPFLFGLLAILSISSSYILGVTLPFSPGMRVLVDQAFLANEVLICTVFFAGLAASTRLMLPMISLIFSQLIRPIPESIRKESVVESAARRMFGWVFFSIFIFMLFYICFRLSSTLFDPRLLFIESAKMSILWIFAMLVTSGVMQAAEEGETILSFGSLSAIVKPLVSNPISVVSSPLAISFSVGVALLSAYTLGQIRIVSLALAPEVCLMLEGRTVRGKLLGQTSSGIFLNQGSLELDYVEGLFDIARKSGQHIVFINKNSIVLIEPECLAN